MKKILLLFVLFLGLNVGAFAVNEMESKSVKPQSGSLYYSKMVLGYQAMMVCTHFYLETEMGGTQYMGLNC